MRAALLLPAGLAGRRPWLSLAVALGLMIVLGLTFSLAVTGSGSGPVDSVIVGPFRWLNLAARA